MSMAGKTWTKSEEKQLKDEYDKGYDLETMATYHQRTKRAVEIKLTSMGYSTIDL